jgi:hypothetical protein
MEAGRQSHDLGSPRAPHEPAGPHPAGIGPSVWAEQSLGQGQLVLIWGRVPKAC